MYMLKNVQDNYSLDVRFQTDRFFFLYKRPPYLSTDTAGFCVQVTKTGKTTGVWRI